MGEITEEVEEKPEILGPKGPAITGFLEFRNWIIIRKGGCYMEMNILNVEIVYYDDFPMKSGCVTGGGGCSCDDDTAE